MKKPISYKDLNNTLTLSEWSDGFWLYDTTRGMNLSMRAKTAEGAFVEALTYYQGRLSAVESTLDAMREKVDAFVAQFADEEGYWP